jgi:YkoY family integral membrane protein
MADLALSDVPTIAVAIATLVLLEGLLSADNALVLAVMVRHLPKPQQKRALRYGIWGAFIFRAIAVVFAYELTKYWQIKLLGGLYLAFLAVRHFLSSGDQAHDGVPRKARFGQGFWGTVLNVELADVAFSIDSILAAVAMVDGLPQRLQQNKTLALFIIYAGGVLGIVMMRLVAGVFLVLLNRYQGLANGAYVLVGWIGLKLIGSALHTAFESTRGTGGVLTRGDWRAVVPQPIREFPWEIPDWLFWVGMAVILVASLLVRRRPDSQPITIDQETLDSDTLEPEAEPKP